MNKSSVVNEKTLGNPKAQEQKRERTDKSWAVLSKATHFLISEPAVLLFDIWAD